MDNVNPNLVALLRSPAAPPADSTLELAELDDDPDGLRAVRGIVLAMVLSALIWGGLGWAMWVWL